VRPTALILGPSGVGKSHVARVVAKTAGVPILELSLASWTPTNSKATDNGKMSTIEQFAQFTEAQSGTLFDRYQKCVVFIDEVDKLSMSATDNSNWCAFIWTELMRMLDGRLTEFGVDPTLAKQCVLGSYFIFAGAFQRTWDKRNGTASIGFLEQVEEATLGYSDIAKSGIMPKELLNRISGVCVTVGPPDVDEVAERIRAIEDSFFMKRDDREIERDAKAILTSGLYVRGIEQHFTRLATEQYVPAAYREQPQEDDYEDDGDDEVLLDECP
jgi:adenylate kinase family enzyme